MRRKPWIYCCGPYRIPDPVTNTAEAVRIGFVIREEIGAVPIVPHLSLFEDFQQSRPPQYWLDATMEQMRGCDAVFRFSKLFSSGSDAEEAEAIRLGIPVFHDLASLTVWVGEWEGQHDIADGRDDQQGMADAQGIEDVDRA